jgi:hypothetical protein
VKVRRGIFKVPKHRRLELRDGRGRAKAKR